MIHASIPSLYVIAGALLIAAVANIVFNGVTGTGNTRSAFAMELVTLVFYTLFIYVAGMRLHLPVAIAGGLIFAWSIMKARSPRLMWLKH